MKSDEDREKFIELRARGFGYTYIAKELGISKSTCFEWNKEMRYRVDEARDARLLDLYEQYNITKESRIKQLYKILEKIDNAVDAADFTSLSVKDLLEIRTKYAALLVAECPDAEPAESLDSQLMRM